MGGINASDPRLQAAGIISNAIKNSIANAIMGNPQAPRNEALALNNQGLQYFNQGQWKLAVRAFQTALAKSPGDQTIANNLTMARQRVIQQEKQRLDEEDRKKAEDDRMTEEQFARLSLEVGSFGADQRMPVMGGEKSQAMPLMGMDKAQAMPLMDMNGPTGKQGDGSSGSGHAGVPGLPGIYLNDTSGKGTDKPYGIPGLPGDYVNGPGLGFRFNATEPTGSRCKQRATGRLSQQFPKRGPHKQ